MKVVVDTNVLVFGLLSPFGPPGEIVRMSPEEASLCFDARILTEHADVLKRPTFQFDAELIKIFLNQIKADGLSVAGRPLTNRLPDAADEAFLETALVPNAEHKFLGPLFLPGAPNGSALTYAAQQPPITG